MDLEVSRSVTSQNLGGRDHDLCQHLYESHIPKEVQPHESQPLVPSDQQGDKRYVFLMQCASHQP
jgi:hypothetical protein